MAGEWLIRFEQSFVRAARPDQGVHPPPAAGTPPDVRGRVLVPVEPPIDMTAPVQDGQKPAARSRRQLEAALIELNALDFHNILRIAHVLSIGRGTRLASAADSTPTAATLASGATRFLYG